MLDFQGISVRALVTNPSREGSWNFLFQKIDWFWSQKDGDQTLFLSVMAIKDLAWDSAVWKNQETWWWRRRTRDIFRSGGNGNREKSEAFIQIKEEEAEDKEEQEVSFCVGDRTSSQVGYSALTAQGFMASFCQAGEGVWTPFCRSDSWESAFPAANSTSSHLLVQSHW